ncbi:MAG: hypothetical protein JRF35_14095 [Deltaproteobacteria bacterium]|nr:hypothetical protein [Deltaproteobacteria bacterium]
MNTQFFKRAIGCLDARIGIVSNNDALIRDPRYFESDKMESLLTNVHKLPEVSYENTDADVIVLDDQDLKPYVSVGEGTCVCAGDFSRWERECKDIRYSVFGNLGLFFRYSLAVLERFHGIYSFHASSLFIPQSNTVLLIVGGAGAGKTVYLLKGVVEGWKILSTEMTHLRLTKDGYEFYKGSLYDNVRVGSLVYDFPEAIEKLGLEIPKVDDVWGHKVTIDLKPLEADDVYRNPRVQIINARIESDRTKANVSDMKAKEKVLWTLYQNASEKLAPPWLMYERLPVGGCDDDNLARARLEALGKFLDIADMAPVKSILAGVKNCMEGIEL